MLADCSLQGLEREDLVSEDCPPVSPCLLCSDEGGVWDWQRVLDFVYLFAVLLGRAPGLRSTSTTEPTVPCISKRVSQGRLWIWGSEGLG